MDTGITRKHSCQRCASSRSQARKRQWLLPPTWWCDDVNARGLLIYLNLTMHSCRSHQDLYPCHFWHPSRDCRLRSEGRAIMPPPPPTSLSSLKNSPVFLGLNKTLPNKLVNKLSCWTYMGTLWIKSKKLFIVKAIRPPPSLSSLQNSSQSF